MSDNTVQCSACRVTLTLDWDPIKEAVVAKRDGKIHISLLYGFEVGRAPFDTCPGAT